MVPRAHSSLEGVSKGRRGQTPLRVGSEWEGDRGCGETEEALRTAGSHPQGLHRPSEGTAGPGARVRESARRWDRRQVPG